jgi:hypothetical protein
MNRMHSNICPSAVEGRARTQAAGCIEHSAARS